MKKRSTIVIAAIIAAGLLAGCRQEEDRPMVLGSGAYTGGGNTSLTAAQVSALNSRIMLQGVTNTTAGSSTSTKELGPTTAPQPTASDKTLNQRLQQQQTGQ
jgi:hypothetical protein